MAKPHYKKICSVLDEFKPDIIHVVTPFSMGLMGIKYSKNHDIPLVASYHTDFSSYLKSYNLQFLENTIWTFFRWFHSHSIVNFCPSRETLLQLEGQGIQNLKIWGKGIDTQKFSPSFRSNELRRKYAADQEKVLLYVGRLAAEKKLQTLMESADQLNQKNIQYKLLLVGDGPLRSELEHMKIPNVIFTGYKSGVDLQALYASSDIFVFPSDTETYGNVVLEAMASGLPVVAPLAGGIKENLIDKYNGLSYDASSSKQMTEIIEDMIMDDSLVGLTRKNAIEHCHNKSWDNVFKGLFEEYQLVVNQYKMRKVIITA